MVAKMTWLTDDHGYDLYVIVIVPPPISSFMTYHQIFNKNKIYV